MKSTRRSCLEVWAAFSVVLIGCSGSEPISTNALGTEPTASQSEALAAVLPAVTTEDLCPADRGGMHCFAKRVTSINGNPMDVAQAAIAGLTAQDIQNAYKLPASGGDGRLVAIVDAFGASNAEADMNTYRQMFGLPACTTANGCFRKVNEQGQASPLPPGDAGWEGEIMVDLAMVSATCPGCKIVLIEASTSNGVDLGPCVAQARQLNAVAVNNSYGGPESDPDSVASFSFYNQPGMLVVASSGDDAYLKTKNDQGVTLMEIAFPAASPYTLSVGGTTLTTAAGSRGWNETAWSGAGSGCSKTQTKPSWQMDPGCSKRFVADVAAIADPATGVAYYDRGWKVVGGTSVSAPIIAGIAGRFNITDPSWVYAHANAFFDVTSGKNGNCGTYQCTAGPGVDGPTGLGTPNAALWTVQPTSDAGPPPVTTTGMGGAGGAGGAGGRGAGGGGGAGGGTTGSSAGGAAGSGVSPVGGTTGGAAGSGAGGDSTGGAGGDATTGAGGDNTTGGTMSTTVGNAGSSSSGSMSGSTSGGGSDTNIFAPKASQDSGCSCRVGSREGDGSARWSTLAALAIGLVLVRRRRGQRY
jgi:hypothetical protein